MRLDTRWLLAATMLLSLGFDFRGCGGGTPEGAPLDAGRPLPVRTGPCLVDADCASDDMCALMVCRAGRCVDEGPPFDSDGDRVAPPPCGDDCNDRSASTFPGAAEICNRVDDDCDGAIDEDAPGAQAYPGPPLHLARLAALSDGWAYVGLSLEGDLLAQTVALDGTVREPSVIASRADVGDVVDVAAHGRGSQVVVALARGITGPPLRLVLDRVGDALVPTGPPAELGDVGAERVALTVFGGSEWLAWDTTAARALLRVADGSVRALDRGDGFARPSFATDGERLAVTDGDARIRFYDAGGVEVATQTMAGPLAASALASGDGVVYVAYRDAIDHLIAEVSIDRVGSGVVAPAGARDDAVSLGRTDANLVVMRADARGARATLMTLDLREFVGAFDRVTLVAGTPRRMMTATSGAGVTAVGTAYEGEAGLGILRCGE